MNDSSELTNNRHAAERLQDENERLARTSIVLAAEDFDASDSLGKLPNYLVYWVVVVFWIAQYCVLTTEQLLLSPDYVTTYFWPRSMSSALGALLSFGIAAAQSALGNRRLAVRAAVALSLAVASAAFAALMAFVIEGPFTPNMPPVWPTFVGEFYPRIFTYGAISGGILAASYAIDIRRREQRIAALQALADSAQVRALRNQLNPHFLFNALNSIVGLIAGGHNAEAEQMTENVADFLRVSLAMDTQTLISLGDELRLQELYLQIEKVRFPDRLVVVTDIPDELRNVRVPALITQPLIENSIKYAVARSTDVVRLSISARRIDSATEIVIEDDGGNAAEMDRKGAKLGLSNVAGRLHAHYGSAASFDGSVKESGGFRNVILIPNA